MAAPTPALVLGAGEPGPFGPERTEHLLQPGPGPGSWQTSLSKAKTLAEELRFSARASERVK